VTGATTQFQNSGTNVTQRTTVNFTGNLQAVDNGGTSATDVSLTPNVSGLTSLGIANGSTTASNFTSTANGNFTTGAGTGFYYGGATGSLVGANTISSTGAFTGTLFALTADSTTAGTILGISGQSLTTGKAIDVSLGAAYNLTAPDSSGKVAGAVNVRAGAYNGNIFNVLSTANTGATTMNLANLQSGQTDGQLLKILTTGAYAGSAGTGILNIDANTATGGTVARITATSLTGATSRALSIALGASSSATAILANTGATFNGNLIDLQANSVSQLKVDASNTTVAGGLLGSNATSFVIDETAAQPINFGTTTATQINISRSGQLTNVGGTLTSASTLTVTGTTPASALVVSPLGNLAAQGTGTFGPNAGNQVVVQGAASLSPVQVSATGTDANISLQLTPKGTGRANVVGANSGLTVDNDIIAGAASANQLRFQGAATTVPVNVSAIGTDANITLQLTPKGTGTVQINGAGGISGPAAAALVIDAAAAQNINIGGTNAVTVNIGRLGQLQALLGNVTVGGTLGVTGNFSVNTNKFTVAAATGNTLIGGTLTGSGATGFAIDSSVNQPLQVGTAATTTSVTISRAGQTTTVAGLLTVTGNTTLNGTTTANGTVQIGSTGTPLNEIRTGTCTVLATAIAGLTSQNTPCMIVGGPQDLTAFTVTVIPTTTPPTGLVWNTDLSTTALIQIRWASAAGTTINTTALTFRWTAVR
jgi:hypothetical protein